MSAIFWLLTKLALLIALLWALLMLLSTVGIDLLLRGAIGSADLGMGLFASGIAACVFGLLVNPFPWLNRNVALDPAAELIIKPPLVTIGGMIVGLALMACSCAYALASGSDDGAERALAIAGLILFPCALIGLLLRGRDHTLKLSPEGLEYDGAGCGRIAWADIAAVEADYAWRTFVVTLRLRNEEKYISDTSKVLGGWLVRRLWSPLSIPTMMFNISPAWLRRAIQVRIDCFGQPATRISPTVQSQGTSA